MSQIRTPSTKIDFLTEEEFNELQVELRDEELQERAIQGAPTGEPVVEKNILEENKEALKPKMRMDGVKVFFFKNKTGIPMRHNALGEVEVQTKGAIYRSILVVQSKNGIQLKMPSVTNHLGQTVDAITLPRKAKERIIEEILPLLY